MLFWVCSLCLIKSFFTKQFKNIIIQFFKMSFQHSFYKLFSINFDYSRLIFFDVNELWFWINHWCHFFHQDQRSIIIELLSFFYIPPNSRITFPSTLLFDEFHCDERPQKNRSGWEQDLVIFFAYWVIDSGAQSF